MLLDPENFLMGLLIKEVNADGPTILSKAVELPGSLNQ